MNKMLKQAKIDYYSDKVSSCGNDQKSLHKITKHLLQGSTGIRNDIALQAGSGLDTFKFDSNCLLTIVSWNSLKLQRKRYRKLSKAPLINLVNLTSFQHGC